MDDKQTQWRARLAAACLMTLIGLSHAVASDQHNPARTTIKTAEAPSASTLRGNFLDAGSGDLATLVGSMQPGMEGVYALVVMPHSEIRKPPLLFRELTGNGPNPPQLSLVKPGDYKPVCHNGGPCAPVKIATEAISICFGEASCRIVYYNGKALRELVVTD